MTSGTTRYLFLARAELIERSKKRHKEHVIRKCRDCVDFCQDDGPLTTKRRNEFVFVLAFIYEILL